MSPGDAPDPTSAVPPLERTLDLLERVRGGDPRARERLFARFLPVLTAWAHERLPRTARVPPTKAPQQGN